VKRVTLVRHGESTWNATRRWQGHSDPPLTAAGEAQGHALAMRLKPTLQDFNIIESSDLRRANHTAELAGANPRIDSEWRELFLGDWEGLFHREVQEQFPDELAALRAGEPVQLGGGESWHDLAVRAGAALTRLVDRLPDDGRGLVFCHGGVVIALVTAAFDLPTRTPRRIGHLVNTSITELGFNADGTTTLLRFNDAAHLPDRAPRAPAGVPVIRLGPSPMQGERVVNGLPHDLSDASPAVLVDRAERLRDLAGAALSSSTSARLGPLDGSAHLKLHDGAQVLVDYNVATDGSRSGFGP
jgi:broad specificity phosphatase PhoE